MVEDFLGSNHDSDDIEELFQLKPNRVAGRVATTKVPSGKSDTKTPALEFNDSVLRSK